MLVRKLTTLILTVGLVTASLSAPAQSKAEDIVDTAVSAGSFKTLAAALKAAGLVDALKGKGPFTVFAPTDDAFAKLPAGTVESLLKPENKQTLINVLTYHVVPSRLEAVRPSIQCWRARNRVSCSSNRPPDRPSPRSSRWVLGGS